MTKYVAAWSEAQRVSLTNQKVLWSLGLALLTGWSILIAIPTSSLARRSITYISARSHHTESIHLMLVFATFVFMPALCVRLLSPQLAVPVFLIICSTLVTVLSAGAQALLDLLALAGIVLVSYELGRVAFGALRCRPANRLESLVLCTGLGGGLVALAGLGLGLAGLLSRPVLLALMAPFVLAATVRWIQAVQQARSAPRAREPAWIPGWFDVVLLGISASFLLIGYAMGVAPEVMSDATRVHLALARIFADQQRIMAVPHIGYSYWPIHGHVLFTIGMTLRGPIAAKLVHTATGLLCTAAVAAAAQRYTSRRAGLVAAAIFTSLPVTLWEVGTGYIDLFVTLYAALGTLCLLHWYVSGERHWLLLLGMMLGFGIGAKLTFGFTVAGFGLALLLVQRAGSSLRQRGEALLWAALGGLLTGGPWLARSMLLTGEIPGLRLLFDALGRSEGRSPESLGNLTGFGIGQGAEALLRLPWELTFHSSRFGENADGFVGVALLLLLPLLALLRPQRTTLALGLLTLVSFLLWFYTAQYIRYMLPTLALLAILLGATFARLHELITQEFPARLRLAAPLLNTALVTALTPSALFYAATILTYPGGLPVRLVLGTQSPQAYVASILPGYSVLQRLDREVPPDTPVAILPQEAQLYTHARLLGPLNGAAWLLSAKTIPQLVDLLKEHGIGYVVVNRNTLPADWYSALVLQPDFLQRYAQIVYASGNVYLYRLPLDRTFAPAAGVELLENPGFEQTQDGTPLYWVAFGTPRYDTSGTQAHEGRAAVLAGTSSGYYQTVSVRSGQAYLLSYFVRTDQPGAHARLQINWLDSNGKMLAPTIEVVPVRSEWMQHTLWVRAPAGAVFGNVYVSTHEDAPCWFDDFSFKEAP